MPTYPARQATQTPRHLRAAPRPRLEPPVPTLEAILSSFPHLPARTAILGIGRDGLPVLFDLQDDRPGSILVCAERSAGKTTLLQTLLVSTLALSLPHEAQFVAITGDHSDWKWLYQAPLFDRYLLDLVSPDSPAAGAWILRLAKMAEARLKGLQSGPTLLMLIDGVEFVTAVDGNVQSAFEWLLQNGPSAEIWPVAALDSRRAVAMQDWVDRFQTCIIGRLGSREAARSFGTAGSPADVALQTGFRFAVQVSTEWIVFDLPAPDERQTWR